MEKNDEMNKKSDDQQRNGGLWPIIIFAVIYLAICIFFSGCGSASCDAYHKYNVSKPNTVIDTSRVKFKAYED